MYFGRIGRCDCFGCLINVSLSLTYSWRYQKVSVLYWYRRSVWVWYFGLSVMLTNANSSASHRNSVNLLYQEQTLSILKEKLNSNAVITPCCQCNPANSGTKQRSPLISWSWKLMIKTPTFAIKKSWFKCFHFIVVQSVLKVQSFF